MSVAPLPARVRLRPSPSLIALLCGMHTLAAAVLVPIQLPLPAKLALLVAIAASLARGILRHGMLRSACAIKAVEARDCARAAILTADGTWREVDILSTSYVSGSIAVLNLREAGRRLARHVVLVPDNVDAEEFRQLRVVLRWSRPEGT
jgi:toxin CptA